MQQREQVRGSAPDDVATQDRGLALAIHGLTKSYGATQALRGLDLAVPVGVVYGFLGPNGAGKTTTIRCLTGLIRPDGGRMELLGEPFTWRDRHRLEQIGSLVEAPAFYPYLSGRDNLRVIGATGAQPAAGRIDELLDLVGLSDRAGDHVGDYSTGMRQRLGVAAALLSDPRLLILDEPANGMDPAGIVAMRATLRYLAGQGRTVFVSSHILPEVQQLADVVGIIDHGRLVRQGPLDEMLRQTGHVRVRVVAADRATARAVLERLAGTDAVWEDEGRSREVEGGGAPTGPAAADAGHVPASVSTNEGAAPSGADTAGDGWITVRVDPSRAGEVNRVLAQAGVFATGLESGSDLETLFLSLTGSA